VATLGISFGKLFGVIKNNVFTRVAGGRAPTRSENPAEGVVIMSTYEELSLIVSIALLIIAILNYTHKK